MAKTTTITLRLDEKRYKKLRAFAQKKGQSINDIIRQSIDSGFGISMHQAHFVSEKNENAGHVSEEYWKILLHSSLENMMISRAVAKKTSGVSLTDIQELVKEKVEHFVKEEAVS